MKKKQVTKGLVLIPAYNEAGRITPVIQQALAFLPVLVVDDGSSDETAQQAQQAGAQVISYQPNKGKGVALKTGIRCALDDAYDFVITLDSDGQHDPQEIPLFIKAFDHKRSDLIIGRRNFSKMPPTRRLANTLGTKLFSWATRKTIHDNQSGYRLIGRRLMQALLAADETGYEFEVEMIVICLLRRYKLDWVPISTIYADEKSHIKPAQHLSKFISVCLKARQTLKEKANIHVG